MFIRVYDINFKAVGEIDTISSLVYERDYYGAGSFELYVPYDETILRYLDEGCFFMLNNRQDETLVWEDIQISEAGTDIRVKGTDLAGILARRIVLPPEGDNYQRFDNLNAEDIMQGYVNTQCIEPKQTFRKIDFLSLDTSKSRGERISWRSAYDETLLEVLTEIGIYSGLGQEIRMDLENKKLMYAVIEGKDLTTDKSSSPPVIFSTEFDNLSDAIYKKEKSSEKNAVYAVLGNRDFNDHYVYLARAPSSEGFFLKEDCMQISGEDITAAVFEAERRLKERSLKESVKASVLDTLSFQYEKDWNLGDIVTVVHNQAGKIIHERITKIKEIYENNHLNLEVVFGDESGGIRQRIETVEKKVRF